jgi:hypothetical protein
MFLPQHDFTDTVILHQRTCHWEFSGPLWNTYHKHYSQPKYFSLWLHMTHLHYCYTSKSKRRWSELLKLQELETHVRNCIKNWKYCPLNIFFLYQCSWLKIKIFFPQIIRSLMSTQDLKTT